MNRQLYGVIFDLDGTLVDSLGDLRNSVNAVMKAHGFPAASEAAMKQMVGNGIRKLIERALPESERTAERIESCLQEFSAYYSSHCLDRTQPYPGMKELPELLRTGGIRTAVVSNKADRMVKQIVGGLFAPAAFDEVFGMREGVAPKPDPQALLQICRTWEIAPENCAMVGDSDVDILTGKNAGMITIGAAWGFRGRRELQQSGADLIAENAAQLKEALLGLVSSSGEQPADR
ncbi:MAG: HAD family hydrolase [Firmicutes bacterium]|nr:HAD family hydrolase [Bacillota bacterium]